MKKTTFTLIASLLTCSTLFSQTTLADDRGDPHRPPLPHQNDGPGPDAWGPGPHPDRDRDDRHRHEERERHEIEHARHDDVRFRHDRGRYEPRDAFAWQGHEFRRGHAIPRAYCDDRYRVDDWDARGLPEPPQGEHWADINGNYVLIAAATGIITSLLLNNALN